MSTLRPLMEYVQLATGHLEANGSESPRLDAELLLAHVLHIQRLELYVQHDRPLDRREVDAYRTFVARRAAGEPVAYIVGYKEFCSLHLHVDERVLIPRPDTEILVEAVLDGVKERFPHADQLEVADIGTGSGAVAIALAKGDDRLRLTAADIDEGSLEVAGINVRHHQVEERVVLRQGDLFASVPGMQFHAIASNPPYVTENEWTHLERGVKEFEPRHAIVGGKDGLDLIQRLIDGASHHLKPDGFLALEIGWEQTASVVEIGKDRGFSSARVWQDLAGLDRVVVLSQ